VSKWASAQARQGEASAIGLRSNREIGVAIGILMFQYGVTEQAAFDLLRVTSQHQHRKLRQIAAEVAFSGELPTPPERANHR
jgi:AmiR/NasT family two-component response regulator